MNNVQRAADAMANAMILLNRANKFLRNSEHKDISLRITNVIGECKVIADVLLDPECTPEIAEVSEDE